MAQATFSWPFGPIHLESACLRFRLTAKTAPAPLLLLFPANPLRWASPGVRERLTKTPLGTAQDERSALIFAHPTPSGPAGHLPLTGGVGPGLHCGERVLVRSCNISGAQNLSGCLNSRRATGPWVCKNCRWCSFTTAPGFAELTVLGLLTAGAPRGSPTQKWKVFSKPVGEGTTPLINGRWPEGPEGIGNCPSRRISEIFRHRRAGQCPAPKENPGCLFS